MINASRPLNTCTFDTRVLSHQHQLRKGKDGYDQMIRRFLRLLLVPLMLANQGLCLALVHHGSSAEPEDHASRPHLHIDTHHHTTHDHQQSGHSHDLPPVESGEQDDSLPSAIGPVGEHDSDATYGTEASIGIRDPNSSGVVSAKYVTLLAFDHHFEHSDRLFRSGSVRGQPASVFEAARPIYLRTLSLRI